MIREAVRFDSDIAEPDVALGFSHSLAPQQPFDRGGETGGPWPLLTQF